MYTLIWKSLHIIKKDRLKRHFKRMGWLIKIQKKVTHKKVKKPNYYDSSDAYNTYLSYVMEFLFSKKIDNKVFKKKTNIFALYYKYVIHRYFNSMVLDNVMEYETSHQIITINNKKKQLIISFMKSFKFFLSFTTGYCLTYLCMFKKHLKKALTSFSLQLKMVMGVIENCYLQDFFVFNILGTKKNYNRWLNILKLKVKGLVAIYYVYTPSLTLSKIKLKKIKAIKKRLRKKYTYQEDMV